MKDDKPKISVVMPVFDQSILISNAIQSIRNQTLEDWELIVIDDGSSDSVAEVVQRFQMQDNRIKYFWKSHEGLVAARNYGNSLAKADVIAIQDADDLSMPDRLEKCYKAIKAGADVVVHDAYTNFWDKQFDCITRGYIKNPPFNKYNLLQGQCYTGWPVFRKRCWEKKPFRMETQFAYDWMMHLDWALSNFSYKALDIGLYEYVRHENSASITYEKDGRRKQSMDKIKEIVLKEYDKRCSSDL